MKGYGNKMRWPNTLIWVLDAGSGDVFRIDIPDNFPENGDYEEFLDRNLPKDVRIKDCSWMLGNGDISYIHGRT